MAAYELNIIEIAAKKLYARGNGLQSPELRYEESLFLKWLEDNIKAHVSFKQICLDNGVEPAHYNKYFETPKNGVSILDYILQDVVLQEIGVYNIEKRPLKDSIVYSDLQKIFSLSEADTEEIVTICANALKKGYTLAIASKKYTRFFEIAKNDFLEIRNTLCYNIAQKEMDRLYSELTGSVSNDLKYGLKIVISTIQLIHYDLLPSPWNEDIHFTIEGDIPKKNTLPSVLYSYYSALKNLLVLIDRNQNSVQYKAIFKSKIEPFFETFQKEENSFLTKSLRYHYKWHVLGLDFLYRLPKQIDEVAQSQDLKKEEQSSAKSFVPSPPSTENDPKIKIDDRPQPTSLEILEMNATESKSIRNSRRSSSGKVDGKEKLPSNPEIRSQTSSRSSSSFHKEEPSSIESFAPPILSAKNNPEMKIELTALQPPEMNATESKAIRNSRSASSEKADGKEKLPSNPEIRSQTSSRSSSLSHFETQKTSVPSSASSTASMAAYKPSIFEAEDKASNKQMHAVLLDVIVQRMHSKPEPGEQPGICSPIFHPRYLSKSEESSSKSVREDHEDFLFRTWLLSTNTDNDSKTIIYDDFNEALRGEISKSLPEHIDIRAFSSFNIQIMYYFLEDSMHDLIAIYAAKNNLLTTKHSKIDAAYLCIASFCTSFNLDIQSFIVYEETPRLFETNLGNIPSASDTQDSSFITRPIPKELVQLKEDEMKKLDACKRAIQEIDEMKKDRANLDLEICKFCRDNNITKEVFMGYAKTLPQNERDASIEVGLLSHCVQLAKNMLSLDKEIQRYDDAIKAVKTLQYINKYELMIQDILRLGERWMRYTAGAQIITLYGLGLIKPYLFKITFEKYQELVERKENSFSKIKHEVYYRVAEKEMAALENVPSTPLLIHLKLRLQYIVTIIELASYDVDSSSGKKISYTFNEQLQEKYIPPVLYLYHEELKKLIEKAATAQDQASYLQELNAKIAIFQSELADDSIHYTWHSKFLTQLYIMANSLLEKSNDGLSSKSGQPSPSQSSYSSSSNSFYSEDRRRNSISSASSSSAAANDSHSGFRHSGSE